MALKKNQWDIPGNLPFYFHEQKKVLFSTNDEAVQGDCLKIERNRDKNFTKNKKQTTTKDFFKL